MNVQLVYLATFIRHKIISSTLNWSTCCYNFVPLLCSLALILAIVCILQIWAVYEHCSCSLTYWDMVYGYLWWTVVACYLIITATLTSQHFHICAPLSCESARV